MFSGLLVQLLADSAVHSSNIFNSWFFHAVRRHFIPPSLRNQHISAPLPPLLTKPLLDASIISSLNMAQLEQSSLLAQTVHSLRSLSTTSVVLTRLSQTSVPPLQSATIRKLSNSQHMRALQVAQPLCSIDYALPHVLHNDDWLSSNSKVWIE